jgi:flagellar basal-body rod protein FlgB
MTEGLEAITTAVVSLALDAATLRQQAISANIANAHTAGYIRQEVSFERQLDDARRDLRAHGTLDPFALGGIQPRIEPMSATANGATEVKLDMEMADIARNTVHYQSLVKGLARHFGILSSAISEGKK